MVEIEKKASNRKKVMEVEQLKGKRKREIKFVKCVLFDS